MGINYSVMLMIKRLFLIALISIVFFQPVNSARALEGLVKFPNKQSATVLLEVAVTDAEKSKGLMNRSSLAKNRGMVFVFKPAQAVTFWMKDTLIPLDMIFINRGVIVNIVKNAKPNQTDILYPSGTQVTEVIEVNGGFADENNITVGSKVIFENIAQIDYSKKSKLMIAPR